MLTYLQLTNKAIEQSGVDADELTSGNFANPPTRIQKLMKGWVAQAWQDIQMEREDWEFKSRVDYVTLYPRINVITGSLASGNPPAGSVLTGVSSGATATVHSVVTTGDWTADTGVATLNLVQQTKEFYLGETINLVTPLDEAGTCVMEETAKYNMSTEVSNLDELVYDSMVVMETGQPAPRRMVYKSYDQFLFFAVDRNTFGKPQVYAKLPTGELVFYPKLNTSYKFKFAYSVNFTPLTTATDVPSELDSDYHDVIYWRAVMYWAMHDSNMAGLARAKKRHDFFYNKMVSRMTPTPSFGGCLYDGA